MKTTNLITGLLPLAMILAGCGGGGDKLTEEQQACVDYIEGLAGGCARCEFGAYQECFDDFMLEVVRNCSRATGINDKEALYGTCLPWLENANCTALDPQNLQLDPSCQDPLILDPKVSPAAACEDISDAFADLCVRCQIDTYHNCYDIIPAQIGGCGKVVSVRNEDQLYTECIPWFRTVSCEEVISPGFQLHASCQGQLQIAG